MRTGRGQRRVTLSSAVRDELVSRIDSGRMIPGVQLPPEPELAAELGVSRPTLREALRTLEEEGLVRRTRGAGTFVTNRPRLASALDVNFGVTDAIRASGMRPGTEDVSVERRPASDDEARRLGLDRGAPVIALERVRTADARPVVYSVDILPADLAGELPELEEQLAGGSIYRFLEREAGVIVHHGVVTLRPMPADRAVAAKLRVRPGEQLLYLLQVDDDESGRSVLLSHEHHVADAFEFTVVRRGPGRRYG